MRATVTCLMALATACLLSTGFSVNGYAQALKIDCDNVDAICLQSEAPVPGVRIVEEQDYPKRPAVYLSSNLYTHLAEDRETGRQFCSFDFKVTPAGGGPEAHTHRNEWETFYVEEGNVTFTVGATVDPLDPTQTPHANLVTVGPGTVVYGSQGPVHGFKDFTNQPARLFSFVMPCGLDYFFHTSGQAVRDYNAPIPPLTFEEIVRTAFWAEQRGDALFQFVPHNPVPPELPVPSVHANINDSGLPRTSNPGTGEHRVVLLTPQQVGNITGATAFWGPGVGAAAPPALMKELPKECGGTVEYAYFTMDPIKAMPLPSSSDNVQVFYTQTGTLTFAFEDSNGHQKTMKLGPHAFVQINPGVKFSYANLAEGPNKNATASSLAITVYSPSKIVGGTQTVNPDFPVNKSFSPDFGPLCVPPPLPEP